MEFNLSASSIQLLKDTVYGVDKRITSLIKSNPMTKDAINSLIDTLFMTFTSGDDSENKVLYAFTRFMAKAIVLSYNGMLDNDKNLNKLKQRAEEAHEKAIVEGKSDDTAIDFLFGFDGLFDIITVAIGFMDGSETDKSKVEGRSMSNMLSSTRSVGVEEYLSGGYPDMDIQLVALLSNRSESELNEVVKQFILEEDAINGLYKDSLDQVMTTYKYLFQDSFGLRPYAGVLSFSDPYMRTIDDSMHLSTMDNSRASFDKIHSILEKKYDVNEVLDRQFDIKAIISSGDSKPYYYPIKMLEYAGGRELTYELSENVYRNFANNRSWEEYANGYVRPSMITYFTDCIYYSLERHFDYAGLKGSSEKDLFLSSKFDALIATDVDKLKVRNYLASSDMLDKVRADINRLKRCFCTAVIVVKYNNLGGSPNAISLRIVDTTKSLSTNMTKMLFGGLTSNDEAMFDNGDIISSGKFVNGDISKPLPYEIFEFRHDFDTALATAEPLFGYKAVEMFKARGIPLSWDKILLGEDTKGTPVFASRLDIDDFMMQKYTVHNMMAGSRSGKGVMTMNVLASGIASRKPIFYIDRKPDMAVLFYELSGGNMFVINGGQYEGKNDAQGYFSDNGVAISGWSSSYDRMPAYLRDAFFSNKSYNGNFGDYVYYRAIMFILGILMARVELAGNGEVFSKLGGTEGIVVVVDEFKNWQVLFESVFFTPSGQFCNAHRLTKTVKEGYKKTKNDIKLKSMELETLNPDDSKSATKAAKLKFDIEAKEEQMKDMISELDVYCTTLMDKYGESIKHINSKLSAGFKDSEGLKSDIFVIGQHIEIDGFDGASEASGTYPNRDSGGFNVNSDTKGKSLMRGVFNMFQHDWFMGYNEDGKNEKHYLDADSVGSQANKWLTKQKYWAYCPAASMETLRHKAPEGTRYFKPYLVLNKHLEDDPSNPMMITVTNDKGESQQVPHPDYSFVSQCRNRVNDAVPGANLWETVRQKHLPETFAKEAKSGVNKHYGELNEGIGFQGLANQTKMANGMGSFNPAEDLGASKEIADYVARAMGYSDYLELLFDFTPNGLFSTQDIVKALQNPSWYQSSVSKRLPLFAEYGMLGSSPVDSGEELVNSDDIAESGMSDEDLLNSIQPSEPDSTDEPLNADNEFGESGESDESGRRFSMFEDEWGSDSEEEQSEDDTPLGDFDNSQGYPDGSESQEQWGSEQGYSGESQEQWGSDQGYSGGNTVPINDDDRVISRRDFFKFARQIEEMIKDNFLRDAGYPITNMIDTDSLFDIVLNKAEETLSEMGIKVL